MRPPAAVAAARTGTPNSGGRDQQQCGTNQNIISRTPYGRQASRESIEKMMRLKTEKWRKAHEECNNTKGRVRKQTLI